MKKRAAEVQKQQEARAAREKKEQERAAKFEELKSLEQKWGLRPMQLGAVVKVGRPAFQTKW